MKGSKLPIPPEALEDCGAILGRRGSGKSATGRLLLEHELSAGHRCCAIDPKGDWHGVRMLKDGKASQFSIPVFGGTHGDIEITESMGNALGKTIATHDLSSVIDLSALPSQAAVRRFMRDFATSLYQHNRAPLTLFVDEADQLAPQRVPADMAKLLHAMETLIRLGRQRGIFMWMLTQRPQVLNKNLLSQAETLIAMKMTTPHDRKAIQDWMNAHDPEQAKQVMAQIAKLSTGEAFAWVPNADFLERVQFPLFSTFDSGRTPKHGETITSIALPKIDLSGVQAALKELEVKAPEPRKAASKKDEVSPLKTQIRELKSENRQLIEQLKSANDLLERVSRLVSSAPARDTPAKTRPAPKKATSVQFDLGAERKPLAALARVFPSGLTEAQWAISAGLKRSGGTWSTYKSRLRSSGMIEEREGRFFATDAGADFVGDIESPPPPGEDLARWWSGKLQGVGPMTEALISEYPEWTSKNELAEIIGMAASGGSFSTYLSRLSGAGVIERDKDSGVRLSSEIMEP